MSKYIDNLAQQARKTSYKVAGLSTVQKNKVLKAMAKAIIIGKGYILEENAKDIIKAKKENMSKSFIDRLTLTAARIENMAESILQIAKLDDPIGKTLSTTVRPNKLKIKKVRVPIGVILIVYEARPNVTSDCAALLFKTSNVGILRGGHSALRSNKAIADILSKAVKSCGISFPVFFVVEDTSRPAVNELLKKDREIDLVIPRGGESLIRNVVENSTIPVIKHYKGVCHIFVDKTADVKQAVKICANAKAQRPAVCNAVETILVHKDIAKKFLPLLKEEFDKLGVIIKGCPRIRQVLKDIKPATKKDWEEEYLDLIISLRMVNDMAAAIEHINTFGSHHTDCILTKSKNNAKKFVKDIDSACCFINMSTRFSDGFEFGLGAEIGISTDKLHARGPMGLEELTTYKYIAEGKGQVRG
ncbi:MAG: glutamate-5-semialdehyde dehydrogenase [Candidatus Omnitrophota bacterium]